jgi:hypothetical protein
VRMSVGADKRVMARIAFWPPCLDRKQHCGAIDGRTLSAPGDAVSQRRRQYPRKRGSTRPTGVSGPALS